MNDLVFKKTRKVLLSKQKELKKKGKGNRPNASITLTSDGLNVRSTKKASSVHEILKRC